MECGAFVTVSTRNVIFACGGGWRAGLGLGLGLGSSLILVGSESIRGKQAG